MLLIHESRKKFEEFLWNFCRNKKGTVYSVEIKYENSLSHFVGNGKRFVKVTALLKNLHANDLM